MIKCKNCGNNLQMEDAYCPYCGTQNPYFQKERDFMENYQEQFKETREDVYQKNEQFAKKSVSTTIIILLLLLNVLFFFLIGFSWDIVDFIQDTSVSANIEKHITILDRFEEDYDFIGFKGYYDSNSFYGNDAFDTYRTVYYCSGSYSYIYEDIIEIYLKPESVESSDFDYLASNIVSFYNYAYQDEYDDPLQFSGQHEISIDQMTFLINQLLHTYLNVSIEDALSFETLNEGKVSTIIEEAFINE
ncbi:MAG: zinc ribbon domain-containing protein [Erysipelotrichaceae bacterium]